MQQKQTEFPGKSPGKLGLLTSPPILYLEVSDEAAVCRDRLEAEINGLSVVHPLNFKEM